MNEQKPARSYMEKLKECLEIAERHGNHYMAMNIRTAMAEYQKRQKS